MNRPRHSGGLGHVFHCQPFYGILRLHQSGWMVFLSLAHSMQIIQSNLCLIVVFLTFCRCVLDARGAAGARTSGIESLTDRSPDCVDEGFHSKHQT